MAYDKIKALADNVAAIETAMSLHNRNERPTENEKTVLASYTGFGGIKDVLGLGTAQPQSEDVSELTAKLTSLIGGYPGFSDEKLRENAISGIKASVLTAFYTPKFIVEAVATEIHGLFIRNGLTMRSFLEPSAGTGGFLPVAMDDTVSYAFEKDAVTGLVLKALHGGDANVTVDGYETINNHELPHKSFDVIASNIPFGNFSVFDADLWKRGGIYDKATKTIHNYFFVKSMELLNEGGLLVFITSRGVADTPGNKFVREYLVSHADLITAQRLPDNLFMQTGGIEVGSDLFVFQKHTGKVSQSHREKLFLQSSRENVGNGEHTEPVNRLFTLPNTTLSTNSVITKNQFGKYVRRYRWSNGNDTLRQYLSAILKADLSRYFRNSLFTEGKSDIQMPVSLFGTETMNRSDKGRRPYTGVMAEWLKDGALVSFEGQIGNLRIRKSRHYDDTAIDFDPMPEDGVNTYRAKDYIPMRETYFELSNKEREEKVEHPQLRERLNELYDNFTAKWGYFHDNDNREFFALDTLGVEVFTIETLNGTEFSKADIMREPVAFKKICADTILTPAEALASSLNFYGCVDMQYIIRSTRQTLEDIAENLKGSIFYNPVTGEWEAKDRFIAGNVIEKHKEIISCLDNLDDNAKAYATEAATALENAIPEPIPYEELDINMGERWIDARLYAMFASELFGTETHVDYIDVNDTYIVSLRGYSPVAYNTYSVRN